MYVVIKRAHTPADSDKRTKEPERNADLLQTKHCGMSERMCLGKRRMQNTGFMPSTKNEAESDMRSKTTKRPTMKPTLTLRLAQVKCSNRSDSQNEFCFWKK